MIRAARLAAEVGQRTVETAGADIDGEGVASGKGGSHGWRWSRWLTVPSSRSVTGDPFDAVLVAHQVGKLMVVVVVPLA